MRSARSKNEIVGVSFTQDEIPSFLASGFTAEEHGAKGARRLPTRMRPCTVNPPCLPPLAAMLRRQETKLALAARQRLRKEAGDRAGIKCCLE